MTDAREFVLRNGIQIPAIGFGTGVAKGLARSPILLANRVLKETAKTILKPGYHRDSRYPLMKDIKKDRMLRTIAKEAYDDGCRLFDTARAYQYSENDLGEALFQLGG